MLAWGCSTPMSVRGTATPINEENKAQFPNGKRQEVPGPQSRRVYKTYLTLSHFQNPPKLQHHAEAQSSPGPVGRGLVGASSSSEPEQTAGLVGYFGAVRVLVRMPAKAAKPGRCLYLDLQNAQN